MKDKSKLRSIEVSTRLREHEYEAMGRMAAAEGVSMSMFIRLCILHTLFDMSAISFDRIKN